MDEIVETNEELEEIDPHPNLGLKRIGLLIGGGAGLIGLVLLVTAFFMTPAPKSFPSSSIFSISNGETLSGVATRLEDEHLVRSRSVFEFFAVMYGSDRNIVAGDYFFDRPLPVYEIARRVAAGEHHLEPVRITFPEGLAIADMAVILDTKLPYFDKEDFLLKSEGKEGYLFPDTYLFFPTVKSDEVIKTMSDTFEKKIAPLRSEIASSKYTLNQIITMASIIEGEARKEEDRHVVSGILWHRLGIGMPLQVDATFKYINGKGSAELSTKDLQIKSPYNTYVNKGLPPGPISNPSLSAIKAALEPTASPYLYYLHDADGQIHYGRTFQEHVANKQKYL